MGEEKERREGGSRKETRGDRITRTPYLGYGEKQIRLHIETRNAYLRAVRNSVEEGLCRCLTAYAQNPALATHSFDEPGVGPSPHHMLCGQRQKSQAHGVRLCARNMRSPPSSWTSYLY